MGKHWMPGFRRVVALLLACAMVFASAWAVSAASSGIGPDDWRYDALRELGSGGLLEPTDADLYSSGRTVSEQEMAAAVERAVQRLGKASDSWSVRMQPTDAQGRVSLRLDAPDPASYSISPRQAALLAGLVQEFGPQFENPVTVRLDVLTSALATGGPALVLTLEPSDPRSAGAGEMQLTRSTVTSLRYGNITSAADVAEMQRILSQLAEAVKPEEKPVAPQFEMGLPAPIGSVAVELSSQAAKRPAGLDAPGVASEPDEEPQTGFDLSTKVHLTDILKVSAAFFTDDASENRETAAAVGVRLGENDEAGFVVGHRVTESASDPAKAVKETMTSVDVRYSLPDITGKIVANDSLTVRAGYELYERGTGSSSADETSLQTTASLVIDYKLLLGDAAFLQAGYRYERIRDLIASGAVWTKSDVYDDGPWSGWPSHEPLQLTGPDATRTVTSINFGYKLTGDTALLLGYRLIDFSEVGSSDLPENLATAEVTIRF
ncbi:MAG: hypothetical protein WBK10_05130 [Bacillota bacterium]|jgi:hypothetical protein|nr:hypothetical protein [Bacillota bacterium]